MKQSDDTQGDNSFMDTLDLKKKGSALNRLTPESILQHVESALGRACTNLCRPYNSYINRVYELEDRDGNGMVVKFYRPGRWSRQALQDEHDFLLELAAEEIPVIAPLTLKNGGTLGQYEDMYFAVFPRKGGRCVDEFNDDQWLAFGTLLGRTHMVGARKMPRDRTTMHPAMTTANQVEFIRTSGLVPHDLMGSYTQITTRIIKEIEPLFAHSESIRIHGDCHSSNLIYRPGESFFLIDFDDMAIGPPVQDFWMLLPGPLDESFVAVDLLLEGYETFRPFDRSSLRLIEPLRAMRFIHYSAWCAHQVVEDGATTVVPDFGSRQYWQSEIDDLADQLERIKEGDRPMGNMF
jgi:Ser/Thr protein kinase RdoA (MazF antagonist)